MADEEKPQWWERQPEASADGLKTHSSSMTDSSDAGKQSDSSKTKDRGAFRGESSSGFASGCSEGEDAPPPMGVYERDMAGTMDPRPSSSAMMYNPPMMSSHLGYLPQYPYGANSSFRQPYYPHMPNMISSTGQPHIQGQYMTHDPQQGIPPHSHGALHTRDGDFFAMESDGYGMRSMRVPLDHLSNKLSRADLGRNQRPPSPQTMQPSSYGGVGHPSVGPSHGPYYPNTSAGMPTSNVYSHMPLPAPGIPPYSDMSMPPTHYDSYHQPPYGSSQYHPYHSPHFTPYTHPNFGRDFGASPPPPPPPRFNPGPDYYPPMHSSYMPRQPYPESPHRSIYHQSPHFFDAPSHQSDSHPAQQTREELSHTSEEYREEGSRPQRPTFFQKKREKENDKSSRMEQAEDTLSSDDKLNFVSPTRRKSGNRRKCSVLSADSLENVVGSPGSPMTPSTPLSPEYKELSSTSSSAPFSPTPPPSPAQGAIPKQSDSRQAVEAAKDLNHKVAALFKDVERVNAERRREKASEACETSDESRSGRSSANQSASRISASSSCERSSGAELDKSENEHDVTRDSNESQYDNVRDSFPRIAPFPPGDSQSLDDKEEVATAFRSESPRVGDVGFVRATLDTPQTLLASTRLVQATLKPSPKPTTFFIALESKFVMPDFSDPAKSPNDKKDNENQDLLKTTPENDRVIDNKSVEDDRDLSIEQDSLMEDFSSGAKAINADTSSISPDNVSVSPADYHESQLVMKNFVQNWDEINSEKVPEDLDEFFLVLDCDGAASQYHFLSGSTSPRSSSSESFYGNDELEEYQQSVAASHSAEKCDEPDKKPKTYQPLATMVEEEEDLKTSLDLSLTSEVSALPSPSQPLQVKCSTSMQRESASAVSPEIPHFSTIATAIKSSITKNTNFLGDALSKLHRSGEELSVPVLLGSSKSSDSSQNQAKLDAKPKPSTLPDQTQPSGETSEERLSKPTSSGTKSLLQSFLGSGKSFARPSPPRVALGNKPIVKPNSASAKSPSDGDPKLAVVEDRKLSPKLALPTFQTNVNFIFINTHMDAKKGRTLSKNFPKIELTSRETKMTCFPNRESVKRRLFPEKNNNSTKCENIQLKKELSVCQPQKSSKIPVKKSVFRSLSENSRLEDDNSVEVNEIYKNNPFQNIVDSSIFPDTDKLKCSNTENNPGMNEVKNENVNQSHNEATVSSGNVGTQSTRKENVSVSQQSLLSLFKENASSGTRRNSVGSSVGGTQLKADSTISTEIIEPPPDASSVVPYLNDIKLNKADKNEKTQLSSVITDNASSNYKEESKTTGNNLSNCTGTSENQAIKPKQRSKSQSNIPTLKQPRVLSTISRIPPKSVTVQRNIDRAEQHAIDSKNNSKKAQKSPLQNQPQETVNKHVTLRQKVGSLDCKVLTVPHSCPPLASGDGEISLNNLVADQCQDGCVGSQASGTKRNAPLCSSNLSGILKPKFSYDESHKVQVDGAQQNVGNKIKSVSLTKPSSIPMRKDVKSLSTPKKLTGSPGATKSSDLVSNSSEACIVKCIRKADPLNVPATSPFKESGIVKEGAKINIVVVSRSLPCISEEHLESYLKWSSSLTKLDLWSNVRDDFVSKLLLSFVKQMSYLDLVNFPSRSKKFAPFNEETKSTHDHSASYNQSTNQTSKLKYLKNQATFPFHRDPTPVLPPTVANDLSKTGIDLGNVAEVHPCSDDPSACPVTVASCATDIGSPPHDGSFLHSQNSSTCGTANTTEVDRSPPKSNTANVPSIIPTNIIQEVKESNENHSETTKLVCSSRCSGSEGTVSDETGSTASSVSSALESVASAGSETSVPIAPDPAPVEQCSRSVPSTDPNLEFTLNFSDADSHSSAVSSEHEFHLKIDDTSPDVEDNHHACTQYRSYDSVPSTKSNGDEENSYGYENVTKEISSDDGCSNDSGRGEFTVYTNRFIETSDVEISDDNISDFSDEEIVLSVSSEDSDSKEDISEPLFIPSLSATKLGYNHLGEKLSIEYTSNEGCANHIASLNQNNALSNLTNQYSNSNKQETSAGTFSSPVLCDESRAVALDLVSQALNSSSVNGAMEGIPFLKREELDQLATIIANKLLQSNPSSLTTSVTSADGNAEAVISKATLTSTSPLNNSAQNHPLSEEKPDLLSVERETLSRNFFIRNHSNLSHQINPSSSAASHSASPVLSVQTEGITYEKCVYNFDGNFIAVDSSLSPSGSIASSAVSGTDSNCGAGPYLTPVDGPASVSSGDSVCVSSGYSVTSSDSGVSVNSTESKNTSSIEASRKAAARVYSEQEVACNFDDNTDVSSKKLDTCKVNVKLPDVINTKGLMDDRTGVREEEQAPVDLNEEGSAPTCLKNLTASAKGNDYPANNAVMSPRACVIQGDSFQRVARDHFSGSKGSVKSFAADNLPSPFLKRSLKSHLKTPSGQRNWEETKSQENHGAMESHRESHDVIAAASDLEKTMLPSSWVPDGETNHCKDVPSIAVGNPGVKSVFNEVCHSKKDDESHSHSNNGSNFLPTKPVLSNSYFKNYNSSSKGRIAANTQSNSANPVRNLRTGLECNNKNGEKTAFSQTPSSQSVRDSKLDAVKCPSQISTKDFVCQSSSKDMSKLQHWSFERQDFPRYSPVSLTELAARAHKQHLVHVYNHSDTSFHKQNSLLEACVCPNLAVPGRLNQEDNIDSGFESVTKLLSLPGADCEHRSEQSFMGDTKNASSHESCAPESTNVVHETQSAGIKTNKRELGLAQVCLGTQVANMSNSYGSCDDASKYSLDSKWPVLNDEPRSLSLSFTEAYYPLVSKTPVRDIRSLREKFLAAMSTESISSASASKERDSALENESNSHQPCSPFKDEQIELSTTRRFSTKPESLCAEKACNIRSDERLRCDIQNGVLAENTSQSDGFPPEDEKKVSEIQSGQHDRSVESFNSSYGCEEENEKESSSSITSTIRIPMGKIESLGTGSSAGEKITDLKVSKPTVTDYPSNKSALIGKCERERLQASNSDHCAGKLAMVETEKKNYLGSVSQRNFNHVEKTGRAHSGLDFNEFDLATEKKISKSCEHEDLTSPSNLHAYNTEVHTDRNFVMQEMNAKSTNFSASRKSSVTDCFPRMKDYQSLRKKSQNAINNFVRIRERSHEELDKSDESFEEINWEIENDRMRKLSHEMDKPDRKISDSSGVSSLSNSSNRKLSSSSNISSPDDDWQWFPGRKNSFHCDKISRKISAASSGCSSGISSLQEIQDNRKISVCSGISNLQRIREESSSHFSESSGSEGDLNLLDDTAESPDGALPVPPPPVWPTFTDQKPPKPPRRSTLGILYDNNTVRFDELQVRNCNSLKRDKRLSQKRDRRRTLHTFNNIFDEWHRQQFTDPGLSGSLEVVKSQSVKDESPCKSSSDAELLNDKDVLNSFQQNGNDYETSPSLIGAYDSGESVEQSEVTSTHKIGYFKANDSESEDSDGTGEMYSIGVQNASQFTIEKLPFKRRGLRSVTQKRQQNAYNDEIRKPSDHLEIKKLKSRDARSLPNLSDVGEAIVLDDPVIPERKNRKPKYSLPPNFENLQPGIHINRSEFNINELQSASERLPGRVKHAQSDDAILEKGYAEFSGSEHESDMEDINMQFFEPKSKLRVSLPRRQPSKQSKRSQRFHQLKRKFSFNSIDKSKELKDSISTSLQRFKSAKNKFEKLVSKSLKRDAPPPPSLVRASRILSAPTDAWRYAFDDSSHSSSGTFHNGHNLSTSTSFNSTTTSSSKNSLGLPPEGFSITRTYTKVSEIRHYEPCSLNGSESSYSWDDADSDFEYFKVSPGTVSVSLEPGPNRKYNARGVAQLGGSLGRQDGVAITKSLSEHLELRASCNTRTQEPVTAGMIPSGVYAVERPALSLGAEARAPAQVAPSSSSSDVLAWILQQNSLR